MTIISRQFNCIYEIGAVMIKITGKSTEYINHHITKPYLAESKRNVETSGTVTIQYYMYTPRSIVPIVCYSMCPSYLQ